MEYFSYCNIPPRCWLSFCVNPMSKESPLLFSIKSKIFPNDLVQVGLTLSSFLDAQFAQEQSTAANLVWMPHRRQKRSSTQEQGEGGREGAQNPDISGQHPNILSHPQFVYAKPALFALKVHYLYYCDVPLIKIFCLKWQAMWQER